ncbi:MAG: hypothetical protein IJO42_04900, partial [Clostridia bacterium]|nr:hypothetical protein [Clostridia bacterium]
KSEPALKRRILALFTLFVLERHTAFHRPNRIKTTQNLLAFRSQILGRKDFCSIEAQNTANAVCICEYFNEDRATNPSS